MQSSPGSLWVSGWDPGSGALPAVALRVAINMAFGSLPCPGYFWRQHVMQAAPCSLCKGLPALLQQLLHPPVLLWGTLSPPGHIQDAAGALGCVCVFLEGL